MKQVHYVISKDNEYLVILPKFNNIAPPCEYDFNPSKKSCANIRLFKRSN